MPRDFICLCDCILAMAREREKGNDLYQFLRGLKGDERMSPTSRHQINDMMQSLKPPKEKAAVQPPHRPS